MIQLCVFCRFFYFGFQKLKPVACSFIKNWKKLNLLKANTCFILHLTLKDLYFCASSAFFALIVLSFSANFFVSGISSKSFIFLLFNISVVYFSRIAELFWAFSEIILDNLLVISACIEWNWLLNSVSSVSRFFLIS